MMRFLKNWAADFLGKRAYRRFLEKERRKERLRGQLFSVATVTAGLFYIAWCFAVAQWRYWYAVIPFLCTELVFLILLFLWIKTLWNKRYHRPEGPPLEKINLSVDVFITICREPLQIIEPTLAAAISITYQNKKVYVLDDGEDENAETLCRKYGAFYLRRPSHEHRKAGNLNYALARTGGDLILALDADQVAEPDIIDRLIGYFTLQHVGFIQTKQSFELPKGDPWGNSDEVFYDVMQAGKDYDNAAISCGSGVLYRRKALESVGGFSAWNLVEDVHTSMLLHGKGWRSVYHGQAFTRGSAPIEVLTQAKQRWKWAVDSLRLLFWDNPLFRKGMSMEQRLQYFHFGFHYLAFGLFLPVFFLLPIWALFSHHFMLPPPLWRYLLARLPYFVLHTISSKIITERLHSFKIFQAQGGLFAVYFNAVLTSLLSKNSIPRYTVTKKVPSTPKLFFRIYHCLPHLVLIALSLAAIVYGLLTIDSDHWFLFVNIFWCLWTISILSRFVMLSLWPGKLIK